MKKHGLLFIFSVLLMLLFPWAAAFGGPALVLSLESGF